MSSIATMVIPSPARHAPVTIPRRFCGPPDSGNGGYSCGVVASAIDGPAEVTLRAPPPLDTPMTLVPSEEGVRMMHGETVIATARPTVVDLDPPAPPSLEEAGDTRSRYPGPEVHTIPGCFVCGPAREAGDGLRIFAGAHASRPIAAATWTPAPEFADETGRVARKLIWSALDCPGYFGLLEPGLPALLGRMSAEILEAPTPGEACIVVGWKIDHEGRKYHAGTALYTGDGRLLAKARQTWIKLSAT